MNKIKIIHILDSLCIGGMENLVIDVCNNLDTNKFDICILTLSNDELTQKIKLNANIRLRTLPYKRTDIMSPFFLLKHFIEIARIIKSESPQIVHTHIYQCRLFPLLFSIKYACKKAKHFHTIHTSGIHYDNISFWHYIKLVIERCCYKYCKTNLIAVSENVYEKCYPLLKKSYNNFIVINNGVDLNKFNRENFTQMNHKPNSYFNIVYVSRLHPGKNHITLLKSIKNLSIKYPSIKLHIVGDGILKDKINKYVTDNGLSEFVEMHGERNDVEKVISICQIGVFPSEYEGLSIALLEMMAMKLPIVCSDIPSFRKILVDENNALFFKTHSHEDLFNCIEKLFISTNLRNKYAISSYEIANKYSLKKMISDYETFYTQVYTNNK